MIVSCCTKIAGVYLNSNLNIYRSTVVFGIWHTFHLREKTIYSTTGKFCFSQLHLFKIIIFRYVTYLRRYFVLNLEIRSKLRSVELCSELRRLSDTINNAFFISVRYSYYKPVLMASFHISICYSSQKILETTC